MDRTRSPWRDILWRLVKNSHTIWLFTNRQPINQGIITTGLRIGIGIWANRGWRSIFFCLVLFPTTHTSLPLTHGQELKIRPCPALPDRDCTPRNSPRGMFPSPHQLEGYEWRSQFFHVEAMGERQGDTALQQHVSCCRQWGSWCKWDFVFVLLSFALSSSYKIYQWYKNHSKLPHNEVTSTPAINKPTNHVSLRLPPALGTLSVSNTTMKFVRRYSELRVQLAADSWLSGTRHSVQKLIPSL